MTIEKATLFYLTQPSPDLVFVNLQIGDGEIVRAEISQQQLRLALVDGVRMAYGSNSDQSR